ncbi:MAG: hypothetical protein M0Z99_00790 [Betaproteobacteria bacterium]|nr:hypothetical protein [Betaproteobacteria bacterium]
MATLLQEMIVHVGVMLFQKKLKVGNAALNDLPISEFHAHALADMGNFFVYAKTQITPSWSDDRVIAAMAEAGWFSRGGLDLLTIADLIPLVPQP